MENVGSYATWCTLRKFQTYGKETWLRRMKRNAVTDVEQGNLEAWADSFDVLQRAIGSLPESYLDLHIVFEYGLPRYPLTAGRAPNDIAVFADAIVLSKDTVVVLEFKRAEEPFIGYARQARKYRRRIQDFHEESRGMRKRAIQVLTRGEGISHKYHKVVCCSADLLAGALLDAMGEYPKRHGNVKKWCESGFSVKELAKNHQ